MLGVLCCVGVGCSVFLVVVLVVVEEEKRGRGGGRRGWEREGG